MHSLRAILIIIGLGLLPQLQAQTPAKAATPARPTAGDLREEQRLIGNAYLGDAEFQIKRARERLGSDNHRLAQQSGLWALEQIAYAKRRLERHAPRIEEVAGLFTTRGSEGTRKDLRASYAKVRERYVELEEKLDGLAQSLAKAGLPILADTLNNVRSSSGEAAVAAAHQGLARAGEQAQGDKATGEAGPAMPAGAAMGAAGSTIPLGNSGLTATVGAGGITIGQTVIPGTYNAATQTIASPQFGTVDLKSAQTNSAGVTFLQTDKGVLVVPPGILAPGARLNPDGTITFADGSQASINDVTAANGKVTAAGAAGAGGSSYSGAVPANTQLVGADGRPLTVDGDAPPFQNGERTFVRKVYIGARDTILQRETKVTQRLTEASGATWRVSEALGESRSWSLRIDLTNTQTGSGKLTGKVSVGDAGGSADFTVSGLDVQDDAGQRASVERAGSNEYNVTFTKSGDYTATAEGATDWGSRFRLEATFPIGVR